VTTYIGASPQLFVICLFPALLNFLVAPQFLKGLIALGSQALLLTLCSTGATSCNLDLPVQVGSSFHGT
jgi:hypothetical protein